MPTTRTGRTKCAILGFTQHGFLAPWKDADWDLKGLNDLHGTFEAYSPGIFQTDRVEWYQLHRDEHGEFHGARDPAHMQWMTSQTCPIWMWQRHPAIPASEAYPLLDVLSAPLCHGKPLSPEGYFNNSISWMLAHAILQGYETIGLYGIDMALDGVHGQSEYSYQRPSVEYFIGVARGLGIDVVMPQESELCKTGFLYGYDNITHVRRKLTGRLEGLAAQEQDIINQYEAVKRALHECRGAKVERVALLPPEQREQDERLKQLVGQEEQLVNEYESAKRSLHEVRGAKNNTEWMLRNYFPGDGALQDVPRTERSVVLPQASDGKPINRLAALSAQEG